MHANKKKDAMDERPSTSPGLSFYRSSPAVKFSSPVDGIVIEAYFFLLCIF
jgi:hypothetical protein